MKVSLSLMLFALCFLDFVLRRQSAIFRDCEAAVVSLQGVLLVCLMAWCGIFLFLTFGFNDLLLIGLLLVAITAFFSSQAENGPVTDAITLLFGATLGNGARLVLKEGVRMKNAEFQPTGVSYQKSEVRVFLASLVGLLTFASWWHLDMTNNFYHGPRWMGLWDNPNDYGMLMAVGVVLAAGLLAASLKSKVQSPKSEIGKTETIWKSTIRNPQSAILLLAAFMMGVGLVMSYSRGAWVGAAVGLFYLGKQTKAESGTLLRSVSARQERKAETAAKEEEEAESGTRLHPVSARQERKAKIIWYLLPIVLLVAGIIVFCWKMPDTAPWYLKRLDFSRGSVQHRVAAWRAGFEIMRNHPFGVGWNKTVEIYQNNYFPPESSAAAITTNDYVMLGTQLGIPALVCFVTYVALCLRSPKSAVQSQSDKFRIPNSEFRIRIACRSAALAMLVAFWFDGGLFKLATASVFWILLELGAERGVSREDRKGGKGQKTESTSPHPDPLPSGEERRGNYQSSILHSRFISLRSLCSIAATNNYENEHC